MQVAFFPDVVVTVIVELPSAIAFIFPSASTVTFVFSLLFQVSVSVELFGDTVAINFSSLPLSKVISVLFKVTPVAGTGLGVILTVEPVFV